MQKAITKKQIEELKNKQVTLKLVDIRSPLEYEKLHIPGVINIPSEQLYNELSEFAKDDTIVCICNHGKERSQQAAEMLYNTGFEKTFYLVGGTAGWYT
jgi:rhodanese-related sulfurtransferase